MTADILQPLIELDQSIFLHLNGMHTPFWDALNMMLTGKWVWVPMYASLAAALFVTRRATAAIVLIAAVLVMIALTDFGISSMLRPWLGRLRPSHPENPLSLLAHNVDGYHGGTYGFPSCHGANSFALAMFMALTARKRVFGWFIFLWAVLHSYTRLYLGVHYPGDIVVGAAMGALIGWAMWAISRWALRISGDDTSVKLASERLHPWLWPVGVGVLTVACACVVAICR